jgi:hypothetical protein
MHHDRAEIDQYPAAVVIAFRAGNSEAGAADGLDDRVGDRPGLDLRAAGHDDERIGNDRAALEIQDREIFAFLVFGRTADGC